MRFFVAERVALRVRVRVAERELVPVVVRLLVGEVVRLAAMGGDRLRDRVDVPVRVLVKEAAALRVSVMELVGVAAPV